MKENSALIRQAIELLFAVLDNYKMPEIRREKFQILTFPIADNVTNAGGTPETEACQLNIPDIKNVKSEVLPTNKNHEEKEMPKIKDVYIYIRKDGYYQAIYARGKVRKCFTGKTRAIVTKKAAEFAKTQRATAISQDVSKFGALADIWLETVKKPFVSDLHYKTLKSIYTLHIKNEFGKTKLKEITPLVLQPYFARMSAESSRNAETIRVIMKGVFEYAIGNGLLQVNPMRAVVVQKHERKCGEALSRDMLEKFKKDIEGRPTYRLPYLIFLYTGVRRSEYGSLEFNFESGFVKVRNAKLKRHQKNFFREIPILPQLMELRADIERGEWKDVYVDEVGKAFPKLVPGGRLNWLRHTFQTYCRLQASEEMVNIWSGHVVGTSTTDRIYLHIPKEDQLEAAKNIRY